MDDSEVSGNMYMNMSTPGPIMLVDRFVRLLTDSTVRM